MRLLFEERISIDTNKLDSTLGGCKTEIDVLMDLKSVYNTILAQIDSPHIYSVLIDSTERTDQHHSIAHHMPQVIAVRLDREPIPDVLVLG